MLLLLPVIGLVVAAAVLLLLLQGLDAPEDLLKGGADERPETLPEVPAGGGGWHSAFFFHNFSCFPPVSLLAPAPAVTWTFRSRCRS